jgi:hypothetical protein
MLSSKAALDVVQLRDDIAERVRRGIRSSSDGGRCVVLEHLGLSTVTSDALGLKDNLRCETDDEARAIGEVDLQLWPFAAIFIEIADANDLTDKFFAFHHEHLGVRRLPQSLR